MAKRRPRRAGRARTCFRVVQGEGAMLPGAAQQVVGHVLAGARSNMGRRQGTCTAAPRLPSSLARGPGACGAGGWCTLCHQMRPAATGTRWVRSRDGAVHGAGQGVGRPVHRLDCLLCPGARRRSCRVWAHAPAGVGTRTGRARGEECGTWRPGWHVGSTFCQAGTNGCHHIVSACPFITAARHPVVRCAPPGRRGP